MILFVLAATGCRDVDVHFEDFEADIPYISAHEYTEAIATGDLTLVEFCVPDGCLRCAQMRKQIDKLANEKRDLLKVRRVNLNREPAVARQLGVSVCPSYVAFRGGEEVFRVTYPTSADLILARLNECLHSPADGIDWNR